MSTTLLIGRCPAAISRAFSHGGEGPIFTSSNTRAVKRGHSSGHSTITSAASSGPSEPSSCSHGSGASDSSVAACSSRATPYTPRQSGRLGVISSSITSVAIGKHVGERRAGGELRVEHQLVEHHDPLPARADLELVLGEDHPVGDDAAELGLLELRAVRHHGAGPRDGDGLPGGDVGRAAHDRRGRALARIGPSAPPSSTLHTRSRSASGCGCRRAHARRRTPRHRAHRGGGSPRPSSRSASGAPRSGARRARGRSTR